MKDNIAIKVSQINKSFKVPHERNTSLKSAAVNMFSSKKYTKFNALKDIEFEIKKGEFFGIVGKNGSGKSTLLKILANIYQPNGGKITINGTLAPFIELGVGFNPELTGRENVFLSGTILGMPRKKIEAIYDDIVDFAEIGEFMDQKLKNYSSGMQVRLAFSIAVRADSDILLIDEVLAVGDAAFQAKCLNYFEQLKSKKKTVVFVSHDMEAITRFCDSAVLISSGEIVSVGSADMVANNYYKLNTSESSESSLQDEKTNLTRLTISDSKMIGSRFVDPSELIFSLNWKKNKYIKNVGVAIFRNDGIYCFGTNTQIDKVKIKQNKATLKIENPNLSKGNYVVKLIFFGDTDHTPVEFIDNAAQFTIEDDTLQQGFIRLKSEWK